MSEFKNQLLADLMLEISEYVKGDTIHRYNSALPDPSKIPEIENLASCVVKHGLNFIELVKTKKGDSLKFSWLYDEKSPEYLYYRWKLCALLYPNYRPIECLKIESLSQNTTKTAIKSKENDKGVQNDKNSKKSVSCPTHTDSAQKEMNRKAEDSTQESIKSQIERIKLEFYRKQKLREKLGAESSLDDFNDLQNSDDFRGRSGQASKTENSISNAKQRKYNDFSPPPSLQSGNRVGPNVEVKRKHMFSVIGVHEKIEEKQQDGRKIRCFSDTPMGALRKRTSKDVADQIDFYASRADSSSQRDYIPAPLEAEPLDDSTESSDDEKKKKKKKKRRNNLGKTNTGRKILEKMGWKEGTSLGKASRGNEAAKAVSYFNKFANHNRAKSRARMKKRNRL